MPHRCAKRPQLVSHVLNVAASRESSIAERLSQLSRALPGCCKVPGFSLESHALSLFWPQCRCSFLRSWSGVGFFCSADIFFYRRHHCTWSWVTVPGNDPCISLLDREAKGLAIHSRRHALHSRFSVQINPGAFASEPDFCAAHRELANTEEMPFDVALHEGSLSMQYHASSRTQHVM